MSLIRSISEALDGVGHIAIKLNRAPSGATIELHFPRATNKSQATIFLDQDISRHGRSLAAYTASLYARTQGGDIQVLSSSAPLTSMRITLPLADPPS